MYAVGVSYLYQDGIMDVDNNYKRMNFRGSVDYDATNWLKVGFNGVFSNSTQQVPNNQASKVLKTLSCLRLAFLSNNRILFLQIADSRRNA